jgi:hypothetical protein
MKLKEIILFISLLISFKNCYSQNQKYFENDTIIIWNENSKLKWTDFKGSEVLKNHLLDRAGTSYGLYIYPRKFLSNEYLKLNVIALFYKQSSWSIEYSSELLKHEQLHFDIAEIYARKLRRCFALMKKSGIKDAFEYINLFTEFEDKCKNYQDLYDLETDHGKNTIKQLEWENKIIYDLNSLKEYKSSMTLEDIKS